MQTDLKKIEEWCYKQIELINRLCRMEDFPDEVEFCVGRERLIEVHIHKGIEKISSALKLPVHIEQFADDMYEKSVTHLGVKFFQIDYLVRIGRQV